MRFVTMSAWSDFWEKAREFFMTPDEAGINYLTRIFIAIGIIVVAWLILRIISFIYKKALHVKKKPLTIDVSAKFFILTIIKIFYWIGIAFLVIATLKIDVTGAAGIASAVTVALGLALQDIIACFAAGIIILNQKSILTGDFISVQNDYGTAEGFVTKIHFFFTYMKTPNGQEITIPNSNMLHAVVTNYTRLNKRRLNYDVGVAYDTDIELAKKVLTDLFKDDEHILPKEEFSVYVYELGSYSVGLRVRCWTKFKDYWPLYNSMSEKILLAFRENGIRIPSSTDHLIKNVDELRQTNVYLFSSHTFCVYT